jgi:hypothetical protein
MQIQVSLIEICELFVVAICRGKVARLGVDLVDFLQQTEPFAILTLIEHTQRM